MPQTNLSLRISLNKSLYSQPETYPGHLRHWYTGLGTQTLVLKQLFSNFVFSVVFQQKINDFTMHQIILKWLRRQKCQQKRQIMRQKDTKAKDEIIYQSVFIF